MSEHSGTEPELDAITRRWSTDHDRGAHDYTDAGCRLLAEHGFRDVPALVARVRDLEARRDRGCSICLEARERMHEAEDKAEAAEARVAQLETALKEIRDADRDDSANVLKVIARAALVSAGQGDTP